MSAWQGDGPLRIHAVASVEAAHAAAAFAGDARQPGGEAPAGDVRRESSGLYQLLVESVQDYAIFALDPAGNILSWNAGAKRLKGYTREEIVGRNFSTFYPEEDLAAGKPARELEVAAREGRLEDEGWRLRKDGSRFWANVVITALRDTSGTLVGFAKVTRDLTERRRTLEALLESEERFRLMVQSVKDYAIFMLDPDGFVSSWNEGAQRIKGYTEEEIVGRHFSVFYPPGKEALPGRLLEAAKRDGRVENEGWRVRKDGTLFWANVVITALRGRRGELVGYAKVTRDLTERREAEQRSVEAARRAAEAEAANQAKSQFLAAMSHELRTPLNAIGGYVELLEMEIAGPVTEGQQGYLAKIQRSQRHLLGIINDLLNFSRIEAGQIVYETTRVPIRETIDAIVSLLERQAAEKGIALTLERCPDGLAATADAVKTEQIILNLCSNALKFTAPGGRVELACERRGAMAAVLVSDTGVGIQADQIERIFEPFVQLGRDLRSRHEGTGLGLAISRDLARGMGGDLTVQSEAGRGSTFALTLPAAE
ncbi:MAG TPA: PAS domain S-box protein [Terriglobales bacterium]|nr:PAS domain S-box protein [Terriglobales bacterium]